jgi:hypothetical protein
MNAARPEPTSEHQALAEGRLFPYGPHTRVSQEARDRLAAVAQALADAEARAAPRVYLSRAQVAERIGVSPGALSRYKLPEPDAWIGDVRGWLPAMVDAWQERRPGRGARTDLRSGLPGGDAGQGAVRTRSS